MWPRLLLWGGTSQGYQTPKVILSIIVPVYNTAKQLRRCLDSIVTQLNDQVEVILINDGSTDNSVSIIRDYMERYNQLKLYDKPNEGVSASRNIGLKVACGQYVSFVDSDDYVEKDYISKMFANIKRMELDKLDCMVFGFYRRVDENCSEISPIVRKDEKEVIKDILVQKYNAPWNKIFKKSIIDKYKLKFPCTMKTSEDLFFLLAYVEHGCKIGVTNDCYIYNYCDNPCGTVNSAKEQNLVDTVRIYHKIQSMADNSQVDYMDEIENTIMERYYYIVYNNLLKSGGSKRELRSTMNMLNIDLKQMAELDKKNKIKRFLVEHQIFPLIELSIRK